jgi:hypothetical protein
MEISEDPVIKAVTGLMMGQQRMADSYEAMARGQDELTRSQHDLTREQQKIAAQIEVRRKAPFRTDF